MAKKKKEKIIYVDDGRTVADMSGVSGPRLGNRNPAAPRASAKEIWKTYWNAVKMMIGPMLIFIAVITAAYLITWFDFSFLL